MNLPFTAVAVNLPTVETSSCHVELSTLSTCHNNQGQAAKQHSRFTISVPWLINLRPSSYIDVARISDKGDDDVSTQKIQQKILREGCSARIDRYVHLNTTINLAINHSHSGQLLLWSARNTSHWFVPGHGQQDPYPATKRRFWMSQMWCLSFEWSMINFD